MARVLIVDDVESVRISLAALVEKDGHDVSLAADASEALDLLRGEPFDVVVTDIILPRKTGAVLLGEIREGHPDVQVIMITGEPEVETAAEAVRKGAFDYLSKPVSREDITRTVSAAAEKKSLLDKNRQLEEENRKYREHLEELVDERTKELKKALEGTIHVVGSTTKMRDPYTASHQEKVTELACAIAREMAIPEEQTEGIHAAGLMHDIGKIAIPAEILSKPTKLTDLEFSLIKTHAQVAYDILKEIEFPWPVADIILQHHERLDGSGYPNKLKGDEILLEARIIAVADVVEAMASHRPYRAALGIDKALEEISKNKGLKYDSKVAEACLKLFAEGAFSFE